MDERWRKKERTEGRKRKKGERSKEKNDYGNGEHIQIIQKAYFLFFLCPLW